MLVTKNINLVGESAHVIFDGLIVYWNSFEKNHGELSLPRIVENNSVEYRQKYIDLLFELENKDSNGVKFFELFKINGFNYWDFLFSSEFSFQENNTANNFLKIYAFIEIAKKKNVESISVFNLEKKIAKVISFWCKRNSIEFKILKSNRVKLILRLRGMVWVQYVLGLGDILKLLLANRTLVSTKNRRTFTGEKEIVVLDYFDNFRQHNQSFVSGYWGSLPEVFCKKGFSIRYLHFFTKNSETKNISKAKKIMQNLDTESQNTTHELVESYFGFRVFLMSILIFLKINCLFFRSYLFLSKYELTVDRLNLYPIMSDYTRDNLIGRAAAKNAVHIALFQKISSELKANSSVYYLMENQAWEKAAVNSLKNLGIRTIGVVHTYRRFWDFRFAMFALHSMRSRAELGFTPDLILTNSASSLSEFLDFGFSQDQVIQVEAIRYLDHALVKNRTASIHQSPLRILVIGEYLKNVATEQLKFLLEAKKFLGKSVEFVFRIHPSCDSSIIDEYRDHIEISSGSFEQDLAECDEVLAYSSSTAVIQVLKTGKRIRLYKYPKFLDGMSGLDIDSFFSLEDYLALIKESLNFSEEELGVSSILNTDRTLPKWKNYISNLS
jgi:surface carbohydrate biosynthesis protein (TIGR04326 family)